jgi:hypothetical protein
MEKPHKKEIGTRRSGSEAGWHFINLFQDCKMKFYIRHVLKYIPLTTGGPLVFGGTFHEAKAVFYKTGNLKKSLSYFMKELRSRQDEIEERLFEQYYNQGPIMLQTWIHRFGFSDLENYKIIAVEEEIRPRLPNGFYMTMRPDAILKSRDGNIYIMETKTTFSNPSLVTQGVVLGDQATAYIYGVQQVYKIRPYGIIPDIIGWSLGSQHIDKIVAFRGEIVTRSDRLLEELESSMTSELLDISTRVASIKKHPISELFPRNTSYCMFYNHRCEYADVCRSDLSECPAGFKIEKKIEKKKKGKT